MMTYKEFYECSTDFAEGFKCALLGRAGLFKAGPYPNKFWAAADDWQQGWNAGMRQLVAGPQRREDEGSETSCGS